MRVDTGKHFRWFAHSALFDRLIHLFGIKKRGGSVVPVARGHHIRAVRFVRLGNAEHDAPFGRIAVLPGKEHKVLIQVGVVDDFGRPEG